MIDITVNGRFVLLHPAQIVCTQKELAQQAENIDMRIDMLIGKGDVRSCAKAFKRMRRKVVKYNMCVINMGKKVVCGCVWYGICYALL